MSLAQHYGNELNRPGFVGVAGLVADRVVAMALDLAERIGDPGQPVQVVVVETRQVAALVALAQAVVDGVVSADYALAQRVGDRDDAIQIVVVEGRGVVPRAGSS